MISMVLVAVIGTIAFAIGRVSISSFTQVVRLEDSANAYSAATAGIEDGLLRFRFNKDVQTPLNCGNDFPTKNSQYYTRINLTQGTAQDCIDPQASGPPNPSDIAYDIKVSHKLEPGDPEVQQTTNTSRGTIVALARDQAIEYDASDLTGSIAIEWDYASRQPFNNVEVTILDANGNVLDKRLVKNPNQASGQLPSLSVASADIVRIRSLGSDLSKYEITSSEPLSSRTTTIEVVGYYGRSKRKLELTLDRISGSILELFDFVLFSGSGDVSGPQTNNP